MMSGWGWVLEGVTHTRPNIWMVLGTVSRGQPVFRCVGSDAVKNSRVRVGLVG